MDGLEAVTSITSINGVDGVGGLFAGGQTEVRLGGKGLAEKEAVVAVARLLARNGSTLTRLDLRCFARVLPCGPILFLVCRPKSCRCQAAYYIVQMQCHDVYHITPA